MNDSTWRSTTSLVATSSIASPDTPSRRAQPTWSSRSATTRPGAGGSDGEAHTGDLLRPRPQLALQAEVARPPARPDRHGEPAELERAARTEARAAGSGRVRRGAHAGQRAGGRGLGHEAGACVDGGAQ